MNTIVLIAIVLSATFYIGLGFYYRKGVINLSDIIPVIRGRKAKVNGENEFSSSTVATSISLATVIIAFFELIPISGLWLFWAVITTALGFWLFSVLSRRIWTKLSFYDHRPSIHEYISTEFNSKTVGVIASISTAIGYLCMFAVELIVSSQFISNFIHIPVWIIITIIAIISFTYTGLGGFRVVVVSDRIQMWSIWLLLISLLLFFSIHIYLNGGIPFLLQSVPENVQSLKWSSNLIPFVLGLLIMNLFTYITNMALWQRVSGTQEEKVFTRGIRKSIFQSALSWGLFVVIAILAYTVAKPSLNSKFLVTTLEAVYQFRGGGVVLFFVSLGLFGAMLSTASTQLIAVSHTIYEDIISKYRKKGLIERIESFKELTLSRVILVVSALGAIGIVQLLNLIGFSVADLAFSIYGAALSLAPPILISLFVNKNILIQLKYWITLSIIFGFLSAWFSAFYGVYILKEPYGNLVFLSPVFGLSVSAFFTLTGYFLKKKYKAK